MQAVVSLRPYKFQIVAICQNVEADVVIGEAVLGGPSGEPVIVFGVDGLREFADSFEERLQAAQHTPSTNNA